MYTFLFDYCWVLQQNGKMWFTLLDELLRIDISNIFGFSKLPFIYDGRYNFGTLQNCCQNQVQNGLTWFFVVDETAFLPISWKPNTFFLQRERKQFNREWKRKEKYNFEGTCLDEYSAPAGRRLNLFNLFSIQFLDFKQSHCFQYQPHWIHQKWWCCLLSWLPLPSWSAHPYSGQIQESFPWLVRPTGGCRGGHKLQSQLQELIFFPSSIRIVIFTPPIFWRQTTVLLESMPKSTRMDTPFASYVKWLYFEIGVTWQHLKTS